MTGLPSENRLEPIDPAPDNPLHVRNPARDLAVAIRDLFKESARDESAGHPGNGRVRQPKPGLAFGVSLELVASCLSALVRNLIVSRAYARLHPCVGGLALESFHSNSHSKRLAARGL